MFQRIIFFIFLFTSIKCSNDKLCDGEEDLERMVNKYLGILNESGIENISDCYNKIPDDEKNQYEVLLFIMIFLWDSEKCKPMIIEIRNTAKNSY